MSDWVLFDLDETVIDHDTFRRFLVHLLKRRVWRSAAALVVLPIAGTAIATRRWKARGASMLLWIATVGVSDRAIEELADRYVAALGVEAACYGSALQEIKRELDGGHPVAIVTASAELLASRIATEVDPRLLVIGTRLKRVAGGLVAEQHMYGQNKVKAVRGLGGSVRAAYSDSASDLPMLRLAREVVLVNGNSRSERKVRKGLGGEPHLQLVTWRTDA